MGETCSEELSARTKHIDALTKDNEILQDELASQREKNKRLQRAMQQLAWGYLGFPAAIPTPPERRKKKRGASTPAPPSGTPASPSRKRKRYRQQERERADEA